MASKGIKGITIELNGDTTGLDKALSGVNKNSRDLQSELNAVNRLLKFDPGNTEALAQKQRLLSQSIENTSQKLQQLRSAQEQVDEQFERGEISDEQYRAFRREIEFTEASLRNMGDELDRLSTDAEQAERSLEDLGNSMTSAGERTKDVGQKMATGFGAAAVAIGGALTVAVKGAADFDTSMRKAGAIAGATTEEFEEMKAAALELGATTSLSASEVAEAMTELAAKGFTANQTIAAMPGIIAAAEASGESLALAADTVSSALNIWGLEAAESSRVADVLAMSANVSAAGIDDLGYVLKYAGGPAAALGVSLEEVAAAAGIMTNAGLDGSNAGTALRASLLALNNPAKAQQKMMENLGISMRDSEGNALSLSEMVQNLTESTAHMTEADKVATLGKLVGTEAVSGFLSLMKAGPSEIDKMSEALRNSGGASAEAAEKMKAGIGGALENLSGAIDSFIITVGDQLVPIVQKFANWITDLVNKFAELSPSMQQFLVIGTAITGVLAALGAMFGVVLIAIGTVMTVLGPLIVAVGQAGGLVALLSAKLAFLTPLFTALTGPIGIVIAAITGIIAVLVLAYNKVDWFRKSVDETWKQIKQATSVAFEAIKKTISTIIEAVVKYVKSQLDVFKNFWDENGKQISSLVKIYSEQISATIKMVMGIIKGVFEIIWPLISATVRYAWETIKLVVSTGINLVLGIIQTVLKLLQGDWQAAWDTILQTVKDIWANVGKFLKGIDLQQTGKDIIQGLINGIGSMATAVWDKVKSITDGIKDAITSALDIHSPSRVTEDYGVDVGQGLANGIEKMYSVVRKSATNMANLANPTKPISNAASNSRSYSAPTTIIVQNPNVSPSEIARKQQQAQRQMALEWGY